MSRAGYTGHHINSVELDSLGQNGKATHEILYFYLIVTILEELTIIYILIKGGRGRWTNLGRGKLIGRRAMLQ